MRTFTENGLNIYQWMLQYSRNFTILPVKFTLFNSQCANGKVNLLWKTQGSTNSMNFTIERSVNGINWTSVGTLASAGTTGEEKSYTYSDISSGGNIFYRIVETAYDGQKTYSAIIKNNCGSNPVFSLYPNPVTDKAMLNIYLGEPGRIRYYITDSKGSVVVRQEEQLPAGNSQLPVAVSTLTPGIYTLMANWGGSSQSIKFIKN
jgi:hypothetical protein